MIIYKRVKGAGGFTLIEALASILLIGILVSAFIFTFVSARIYSTGARNRYNAIGLAREGVEKMLNGEGPSNGVYTVDGVSFARSCAPLSPSDGDKLEVDVTWYDIVYDAGSPGTMTNKPRCETIISVYNAP